MQHVSTKPHQFDILRSTIDTLAILNRSFEHIGELGFGT